MATHTLAEGDKAPPFSLVDKDGNTVTLSNLVGNKVIVYFYPAASTPGCTTQACDFRDNMASLQVAGYTVLGVSRDRGAALRKFADEENLPFPLLSDPELEVHNAYGTFSEKLIYGKAVMGVIRSTFVIDESGNLTHALYNVRATGHLKILREKLGIAD